MFQWVILVEQTHKKGELLFHPAPEFPYLSLLAQSLPHASCHTEGSHVQAGAP